jgi:RNA polymerase sigma factor (sigma-70 family)
LTASNKTRHFGEEERDAAKTARRMRWRIVTATNNAELAALLQAVARKDRAAFQALYERTAPKLFAIVLRILRERAPAEDVLQDVFLRVWQNAAGFSVEAGSAMGWLIAIARNRAIDHLRTKKLMPLAGTDDAADPYAEIAAIGDREAEMNDLAVLRHCLGELEESARSCVLLAYYEGYSREELAKRFDRPVNTIKTWLFRALGALKSCLERSS